jgi:hypothetical protein
MMNTAQRKNGTSAGLGVLARVLRAGLAVLALAAAFTPAQVAAADRERFVLPSVPMDRGAPQQRQPEPRPEPRDYRDDHARRQMQQDQQAEAQRRGQRMTPDERRDLRRQINEAGMDLYPNRRR